jgi:selT/selW/selH-like putative selenoprotein
LAAELESKLDEGTKLVQSSGGVFEVEDNDTLIFSKKALGRFPADYEVLDIIHRVESGTPLAEAQAKAGEDVPKPVSFFDWLNSFLHRNQVR